jgi:hypothetical protein
MSTLRIREAASEMARDARIIGRVEPLQNGRR